jgi:opacity protein-like surface antigen
VKPTGFVYSKNLVLAAALAGVFAGTAGAQEVSVPKVEVGANFSAVSFFPRAGVPSFTTEGGSGTIVYNFNRVLSGVADLGGYHNTEAANFNPTLFSYLFGPRLSLRKSRVTPYVQALVGGVRATTNLIDPVSGASVTENGFAAAFGGGMDVRVSDRVWVKPFQVEYLLTQLPNIWSTSDNQHNLRYSAGVVFRFGSK